MNANSPLEIAVKKPEFTDYELIVILAVIMDELKTKNDATYESIGKKIVNYIEEKSNGEKQRTN